MSNQVTSKYPNIHKTPRQAEGGVDKDEMRELPYPLKDMPLHFMQQTQPHWASETGLARRIDDVAEAQEALDEQDAEHHINPNGPNTNQQPKKQEVTMSASNSYTKPILIVEDTVELAEVLQATIQSMGLTAYYETHGKTGLEKLIELKPEILLMDIGLPDITGWQMLDNIKQHAVNHNIPMPKIIVITAYGDPANRLVGKLQNVHSYLVKPFTPGQVENLINDVLHDLGNRRNDDFDGHGTAQPAT